MNHLKARTNYIPNNIKNRILTNANVIFRIFCDVDHFCFYFRYVCRFDDVLLIVRVRFLLRLLWVINEWLMSDRMSPEQTFKENLFWYFKKIFCRLINNNQKNQWLIKKLKRGLTKFNEKESSLTWFEGKITSSTGSSDSAGTMTVGFAGTDGGSVVLITWAQSSSSKETVWVGTWPFGVNGGDSTNTLDERGELATAASSWARCSCLAEQKRSWKLVNYYMLGQNKGRFFHLI